MDFIYARQSIDKEDSISIESQIELCLRESTSSEYKIFKDKGYSGKNTERPDFQEMMSYIRRGGVERVIVYRLDRISRSVLDFAGLINEFQKYGVEFVSVTERFDTSTPIGKAMLMIVMIFAQLERETIQQRVIDAYRSRSRKGFYMGGRIPYALKLKNIVIDGIKTSMYESIPEEIEVVRLIYALYSEPQTSLSDVMKYLAENGIKNSSGKNFSRARIRDIVINPIYVKADDRIFEFFQTQGAEIVNDISQFIGTNGAYLYTGDKSLKRKSISINGHVLVIAPSEGWIDSDTWLKCRRKCLNIRQMAKPVKAKNTWLAGKIKCKNCGYSLSLRETQRKKSDNARYYVCSRKYVAMDCVGVGAIPAEKIEDIVFLEMQDKLREFSELQMHEKPESTLQLTKLKVRVDQIEKEIDVLVEKIVTANKATMAYINKKIEELDEERTRLKKEIADMSADIYGKKDVGTIKNYMDNWDELDISDKITIVDALIESVRANQDSVDIVWKI